MTVLENTSFRCNCNRAIESIEAAAVGMPCAGPIPVVIYPLYEIVYTKCNNGHFTN